MESISARDREILRRRAQIQLEYANSHQNDIILRKWEAQAKGRRDAPPVRLLFSNFRHEVVTPRLQCEGASARQLEATLLGTLVGRELFDDDTPIPPTFDLGWHTSVRPFGIQSAITRAEGTNAQGFHFDPRMYANERKWTGASEISARIHMPAGRMIARHDRSGMERISVSAIHKTMPTTTAKRPHHQTLKP